MWALHLYAGSLHKSASLPASAERCQADPVARWLVLFVIPTCVPARVGTGGAAYGAVCGQAR